MTGGETSPHVPDPVVPGIHAEEVLFSPFERIDRHHHNLGRICLVVSGGFAEIAGKGSRAATPGTVYYLPAGDSHAQALGASGARSLRVKMGRCDLDALGVSTASIERPWFTVGGSLAWSAIRLWRSTHSHGAHQLSVDEFVLRSLGPANPTRHEVGGRGPAWLWQTRDRIMDAPADVPRLAELAAAAGVHPAHLARTFREKLGVSIGEFAQTGRLFRACEMLAKSNRTISRIALDLGYVDQPHFTKHFRRRVGVTPAKFRAAIQ